MIDEKLPSFGEVASLIATLGSAAFAASIVYDIGYFAALGYSLSAVPMTLADHSQSALRWLPWSIGGWAFGRWLTGVTLPPTGGVDSQIHHRAIRKVSFWLRLALISGIVIGAIVALYNMVRELWMTLSTFFVSIVWLATVRLPRTIDGGFLRDALPAVLPAVIAIYSLGYMLGSLEVSRPVYSAVLQRNDGTRVVPALRHLERGVLYLDDETVKYEPWASVVSIATDREANILERLRRRVSPATEPASP